MAFSKMSIGVHTSLSNGFMNKFVDYDSEKNVTSCKRCKTWNKVLREDRDSEELIEHVDSCGRTCTQNTRVGSDSNGTSQSQIGLGLLEADDAPVQRGSSNILSSGSSPAASHKACHPHDQTYGPCSNLEWDSIEEDKKAGEKMDLNLCSSDSGSGEDPNSSGSTEEVSSNIEASSNLEAACVPPDDAKETPEHMFAISEPAAAATASTTGAIVQQILQEHLDINSYNYEERLETFNNRRSESSQQLAMEGFHQPNAGFKEIRCHKCNGSLYGYDQKTRPCKEVRKEAHAQTCIYRKLTGN